MRRDLRRRLAQLEREQRRPPSCEVVRVHGGLPLAHGHAWAGAWRFWQEPDEDQAAFDARVIEIANASGEPLVVFGGLPDRPSDLQ
jgi:hypothetical protein